MFKFFIDDQVRRKVPELLTQVLRFAEFGPQLLNLRHVLGDHRGDVWTHLTYMQKKY